MTDTDLLALARYARDHGWTSRRGDLWSDYGWQHREWRRGNLVASVLVHAVGSPTLTLWRVLPGGEGTHEQLFTVCASGVPAVARHLIAAGVLPAGWRDRRAPVQESLLDLIGAV